MELESKIHDVSSSFCYPLCQTSACPIHLYDQWCFVNVVLADFCVCVHAVVSLVWHDDVVQALALCCSIQLTAILRLLLFHPLILGDSACCRQDEPTAAFYAVHHWPVCAHDARAYEPFRHHHQHCSHHCRRLHRYHFLGECVHTCCQLLFSWFEYVYFKCCHIVQ